MQSIHEKGQAMKRDIFPFWSLSICGKQLLRVLLRLRQKMAFERHQAKAKKKKEWQTDKKLN